MKTDKNKTLVSSPFLADTEVEKMLNDWDTVKCALCRKNISMLNADTINDGTAFIHSGASCQR